MNRRTLLPAAAVLAASLAFAGTARAGQSHFDRQMAPILKSYLAIHDALAADRIDGVPALARKIAHAARRLHPRAAGRAHAKAFAGVPKAIATAAKALGRAKDLPSARAAFEALSKPMTTWAAIAKPGGVHAVYCPMKKAAWLQHDEKVENPYLGAKMLACGVPGTGPSAK